MQEEHSIVAVEILDASKQSLFLVQTGIGKNVYSGVASHGDATPAQACKDHTIFASHDVKGC